jgi:hypothetical protein
VSSSSSWREAGGRQYHLVIVVSKKEIQLQKKELTESPRDISWAFFLLFPPPFCLLVVVIVVALVCLFKLLFCLLVVACDVVSQSDTSSEKTPMEKKRKEKKKISLSNRDYFLKKIDPAHHQKAMALWLGFGFSNAKPGQSHHEAIFTARLGLAYLGLAWPGSWPQAGPGTSLLRNRSAQGVLTR